MIIIGIAGAYFGLDSDATKIDHIFKSCESYDDAIIYANELFDLSVDINKISEL